LPRIKANNIIALGQAVKQMARESHIKRYPVCNHWDPNIVAMSGALFTSSLSILKLNSQYEEGARDINNI